MNEYVISFLIFVCTGLVAVLWWIITKYIEATEDWKKKVAQKTSKIDNLEAKITSEVSSVKTYIDTKLTEQESRISSRMSFIRGEMDKNQTTIYKQLKVNADQLSKLSPKEHIDPGRVKVIEQKVNRVYDVIKNLKKG